MVLIHNNRLLAVVVEGQPSVLLSRSLFLSIDEQAVLLCLDSLNFVRYQIIVNAKVKIPRLACIPVTIRTVGR